MFGISWIDFVGGVINVLSIIFILNKIIDKETNFKTTKFIIYSLMLVLAICFNVNYMDKYIRLIITTILIFLYSCLVFKTNFFESIICAMLEQTTLFIAEVIFMLMVFPIFGNNTDLILQDVRGVFITNLLISGIGVSLISIKYYRNVCLKIKSYFANLGSRQKLLYCFLIIITLNLFLVLIYFNKNMFTVVIANLVSVIIYFAILCYALREKDRNIQFKAENKALMDNLDDYEKMLDYQRVANHENKNQLLVVKGMIQKKDKKTIEYIDEIIKDKREDNEVLLSQAKKIPTGGLQGIVYQKMLYMAEQNIKIDLNVDKNVKNIDFSKMDSELNYDLCRIVGIFLDNAIEETMILKEKFISSSIYMEDNDLTIEISNKFKTLPDMSKIDDKGYTTKGEGHGYGLSLVKEIINSNSNITNERVVIKDVFTQKLKIKM